MMEFKKSGLSPRGRVFEEPLISIVCGVMNVAGFIEETIKSVIAQSYKNWELLIMDGASRDGTLDIIRKYSQYHENIRIYSQPDECQWEAVDRGLLMARGDFVSIIAGQDGFLDKEWFAKAVEVFNHDIDISLVWGVNRGVSEAGQLNPSIHPSYSHFIHSEGITNAFKNALLKVVGVIGDVIFGSWQRKKILLSKIFSKTVLPKIRLMVQRSFPEGKVPQKQEWFSYWLKTGLVFPDESMLVSRRVLLECMPRYQTGHIVVNHLPEFYFNFNARGYLAYFVPTEASYGRMHKLNSGERSPEALAQESEGYFKKVVELSKEIQSFHREITFIDRNGREVSRKKF